MDASALAAVMFHEPRAAEADRLLAGSGLWAPTLLPYELASVCRAKCRRFPELREELLAALQRGLGRDIELIAVPPAVACGLALETGLSSYDASYLYLSRTLAVPLVTFDEQLAAAATR